MVNPNPLLRSSQWFAAWFFEYINFLFFWLVVGSKEGRSSSSKEEASSESGEPIVREAAEAVRNRWCIAAEEGSNPVREMASGGQDSKEKEDS